jgi:hypothetical protein
VPQSLHTVESENIIKPWLTGKAAPIPLPQRVVHLAGNRGPQSALCIQCPVVQDMPFCDSFKCHNKYNTSKIYNIIDAYILQIEIFIYI